MASGDDIGSGDVILHFPPAGRRRHVPTFETRRLVLRAAGLGLTRPQIATLLAIHPNTLDKYYKAELETAEPFLTFQVAQNLFSVATDRNHRGCVPAAIFWMKARGGWRDTTRIEHTGADGAPIKHDIASLETIDVRGMSRDDRDQLKTLLVTALAQQALPIAAGDETVYAEFEEVDEEDGEPGDED